MSRIAYLVSEYPAPSHTFIRREIAALRDAGLSIVPFSIRPAQPQAREVDPAAFAETQAVLGRPAGTYVRALMAAAVRSPGRAAKTLALALRHRAPGARALVWALFHFVEALLLARLLREAGATRLHSHFANSGATVGMLSAHFLGLPWSMTLHGVSETDYPAGLLLADKVAHCDFVACASWFMRGQAMRSAAPADWSKLHVVRCGVDVASMPAAAAPAERPLRFICVGRLSSEKGHRGLLEAFAATHARVPYCHLELVGDGPLREELQNLAAGLGIAAAVRFRGALPEAETMGAIAGADVLVLASFMEGLPLVLMEAMALGKPVISSAVAGIPELVRHGENGLLFPASDWNALSEAMIALAGNAAQRERLGAEGQRSIDREFAITNAVRPLVTLFSRETH